LQGFTSCWDLGWYLAAGAPIHCNWRGTLGGSLGQRQRKFNQRRRDFYFFVGMRGKHQVEMCKFFKCTRQSYLSLQKGQHCGINPFEGLLPSTKNHIGLYVQPSSSNRDLDLESICSSEKSDADSSLLQLFDEFLVLSSCITLLQQPFFFGSQQIEL